MTEKEIKTAEEIINEFPYDHTKYGIMITIEDVLKAILAYHSQFPSPQEVTDEEIECAQFNEGWSTGDYNYGFKAGAKWMRSKLTGK